MTDKERIIILEEALRQTRRALYICNNLFDDIRGDWSDPRWQCRTGWDVIGTALDASKNLIFDMPIPVDEDEDV